MMAVRVLYDATAVRPQAPAGEVLIAILFLAPVAAVQVGLGALARLAFPIASMLLAAWFLTKARRQDYLALCLWLFMLTPGLRRLVDLSAGWSQVNVLMLAPYTAALLSAGPTLKALAKRRFAYSGLFGVVFGCILYGLVLAFVNNRIFSAAFELLRWAVPPCFALFVALDPEHSVGYRIKLSRTIMAGLLLLSLYGVYQYLFVPPWDAFWMQMSGMHNLGRPEPFSLKVFSTMNSTGSFANYLMAALLLLLTMRGILPSCSIVLGATVLLLTGVRIGWLGLLAGIGYLVIASSRTSRLRILAGLASLPLLFLTLQQLPEAALVVSQRLETLDDIHNDTSFLERLDEYRIFLVDRLPQNLWGGGLGSSTEYQSYVDNFNAPMMDGAVMNIVTDLGLFVGGLYTCTVMVLAGLACREGIRQRHGFYASCAAVVLGDAFWSIAGGVTTGEAGFIFWITAGLCLGARELSGNNSPRPLVDTATEQLLWP